MAKWFKFYGQDWMTDAKIVRLDPIHRLCYLTLLCQASSSDIPGTVTGMDEDVLLQMTHLAHDPMNDANDYNRAKNVLQKLVDNGMITNDNGVITIVNFTKRQETSLTGYERVKKYREKNKNDNANDNAMITLDKIRVDKKRIDKNRLDKNKTITAVQLLDQFKANPLWETYLKKYPDRDYPVVFQEMCEWWSANKGKLPTSITAFGNWLSKTRPDPDLVAARVDANRKEMARIERAKIENIPPVDPKKLDELMALKGKIGKKL